MALQILMLKLWIPEGLKNSLRKPNEPLEYVYNLTIRLCIDIYIHYFWTAPAFITLARRARLLINHWISTISVRVLSCEQEQDTFSTGHLECQGLVK